MENKNYKKSFIPVGHIVMEDLPEFEPTADDLTEYANVLGVDLEIEHYLLPILREGLKADVPSDWIIVKRETDSQFYYIHHETGEISWDHPLDDYFQKKIDICRREHNSPNDNPSDDITRTSALPSEQISPKKDDIHLNNCTIIKTVPSKNGILIECGRECKRVASVKKSVAFKDISATLPLQHINTAVVDSKDAGFHAIADKLNSPLQDSCLSQCSPISRIPVPYKSQSFNYASPMHAFVKQRQQYTEAETKVLGILKSTDETLGQVRSQVLDEFMARITSNWRCQREKELRTLSESFNQDKHALLDEQKNEIQQLREAHQAEVDTFFVEVKNWHNKCQEMRDCHSEYAIAMHQDDSREKSFNGNLDDSKNGGQIENGHLESPEQQTLCDSFTERKTKLTDDHENEMQRLREIHQDETEKFFEDVKLWKVECLQMRETYAENHEKELNELILSNEEKVKKEKQRCDALIEELRVCHDNCYEKECQRLNAKLENVRIWCQEQEKSIMNEHEKSLYEKKEDFNREFIETLKDLSLKVQNQHILHQETSPVCPQASPLTTASSVRPLVSYAEMSLRELKDEKQRTDRKIEKIKLMYRNYHERIANLTRHIHDKELEHNLDDVSLSMELSSLAVRDTNAYHIASKVIGSPNYVTPRKSQHLPVYSKSLSNHSNSPCTPTAHRSSGSFRRQSALSPCLPVTMENQENITPPRNSTEIFNTASALGISVGGTLYSDDMLQSLDKIGQNISRMVQSLTVGESPVTRSDSGVGGQTRSSLNSVEYRNQLPSKHSYSPLAMSDPFPDDKDKFLVRPTTQSILQFGFQALSPVKDMSNVSFLSQKSLPRLGPSPSN